MNVILLEKVGKLGDLGDQVVVKSGFGRNFLLPYGKAVAATKENIESFEARRAELEAAAATKRSESEMRASQLAEVSLTLTVKAGDEGKLFGSIGTRDIADAISKAGVEVSKSEVRLPEGVIREIGEYSVGVQVHSDIIQKVDIAVVAE